MRRHSLQKILPYITLFVAFTLHATSEHVDTSNVHRRINDASNKLLFIILPPGTTEGSSELDADSSSSDYEEGSTEDESLKTATKDDEAYFLYHILRTTENSENLDGKTARTIQKTKDFLQPILRARCKRLDKCKKQCPKKKKSCIKKCKLKIDIFLACEPKKCKKPKCGKTMPPRWLH